MRRRWSPLGRLGALLSAAAWLLVAAYVAPVLVYAALFLPPRGGGPPFSLPWAAAWTTGQALLSAAAAVAVGWPLGVLAGFYDSRAAKAAVAAALAPFMSPVVVAALGLRSLYLGTPLGFLARGWSGVVALNSYFNIGLVAALVAAAAAETERGVVEGAVLSGLRGPGLWGRVLLPLTARAAAYGGAVAFLYSFTSASPLVVAGAAYRYYTLEAWIYTLHWLPWGQGYAALLAVAELAAASALGYAVARAAGGLEASPLAARAAGTLRLRGRWRLLAAAYSAAVVVYLYAPLAALARDAAQASLGSLAWAASAYGPGLGRALANSVLYAAATVAAALPLGVAAAASRSLSAAALSTIAVAPVAYGVAATVVYFSPLSRLLGDAGASIALILLAHLAAALPLASRALDLARARVPRETEEAMLLAGLRGAAFLRHWLKAAAPAAVVAAGLSAAASLGEFGATIVVSIPSTWSLTVLVYQLMGTGRLYHEACLAALLLEALSLAAILAALAAAKRLTGR